MTNSRRFGFIGAITLLSVACSQQEAPSTDAATTAATATASAEQPAAAPAPVLVMQSLSAGQLAEMRDDAPTSCNIEAIGEGVFKEQPITVARGTVNVSGWFLSENSKRTGVPAALRIVNAEGNAGWDSSITTWSPRPDVMTAMNITEPGDAGFSQAVDLSPLAPGTYLLSVVFSDGGLQYSCDKDRSIVVN